MMIDTVWMTSNLKYGCLSSVESIKALVKTLNPDYKIASEWYEKEAIARKKNLKYRKHIVLIPKVRSKKMPYIKLKLMPLKGFRHLSSIKIEADVSKFPSLDVFLYEFRHLFADPTWKEIIQNHVLIRCDLIFDIHGIGFEELQDGVDYGYARRPYLGTDPTNGRKTLYFTKNHYFYEKGEGVIREERRIFSRKEIFKRLKVQNIFQLRSMRYPDFQSLFLHKKIYQVDHKIVSTLPENDQPILETFFLHLNDKSFELKKTSKGEHLTSYDCFICAKQKCNLQFNRRFSRKIIPRLKELEFDYYSQLQDAFNSYFSRDCEAQDYMIEERTKKRVERKLSTRQTSTENNLSFQVANFKYRLHGINWRSKIKGGCMQG